MNAVIITSRLILAAVFAVAGLAKLVDRPGTQTALRAFGVPGRLARPAALVLPLCELALAVALVAPQASRWGAVAALVLLLLFAAGIARAMAHGRQPDCHCFGQLHSAPAGGRTLVRNLALAALATVVVVEGSGPSVGGWIGSLHGSRPEIAVGLLVGLIVVAQAAVILTLLKRYGRTLLRVEQLERSALAGGHEGLAVGELAPEFELPDLDGHQITLSGLREPGMPLLLVFSDPKCGPCESLLPQLARWQAEHADRLAMALISQSKPAANAHIREQHGIDRVVLREGQELDRLYRIAGTPTGVLVDVDGRVASPPAPGGERIAQLVETVVSSDWQAQEPMGVSAPGALELVVAGGAQ